MKMSRLVSTLCVLFPTLAWSNPYIHSIWATSPLYVGDTSGMYSATSAKCAFSWNTATGHAFVNARATAGMVGTAGINVYEFQLLSVTAGGVTSGQISGVWNVTKNNVMVCGNCQGTAYGLNSGVGNYFKIYVGPNNAYHLSAYITSAYNY